MRIYTPPRISWFDGVWEGLALVVLVVSVWTFVWLGVVILGGT